MKYMRVYRRDNVLIITDKWLAGEIAGHIRNGKYISCRSVIEKRKKIKVIQ